MFITRNGIFAGEETYTESSGPQEGGEDKEEERGKAKGTQGEREKGVKREVTAFIHKVWGLGYPQNPARAKCF